MSAWGPAVWEMVEKKYLESASDEAKKAFAGASDTEKKRILRDDVKKNAAPTAEGKKWTKMLLDMLRD